VVAESTKFYFFYQLKFLKLDKVKNYDKKSKLLIDGDRLLTNDSVIMSVI